MKGFTSQVCTDRHQSQRLLEMGLNPETADMALIYEEWGNYWIGRTFQWEACNEIDMDDFIPAWSLHRLIELMDVYEVTLEWKFGIYECVISMLEERIKDGLINKEYLKQ